jgi:integrase
MSGSGASTSKGENRMKHDGERSRRVLRTSEPRPKLDHLEEHKILDAIDDSDVSGLRDRALIALMFYNHLRLGSALRRQPKDMFWQNDHPYLRILRTEKWHQEREIFLPCFPEAYAALIAYVENALFPSEFRGPLFRTVEIGIVCHKGVFRPCYLVGSYKFASVVKPLFGLQRMLFRPLDEGREKSLKSFRSDRGSRV